MSPQGGPIPSYRSRSTLIKDCIDYMYTAQVWGQSESVNDKGMKAVNVPDKSKDCCSILGYTLKTNFSFKFNQKKPFALVMLQCINVTIVKYNTRSL